MNFTNVEDHANAMVGPDYIPGDTVAHALAVAYGNLHRRDLSIDTMGLTDRVGLHIEAAYHLLTVAETVQRSAPVEPDNIVEFPSAAQ